MRFDTREPSRSTGPAFGIEHQMLLIERLQAFGLIESNGHGGWQMTECCQAGLATLERDASPEVPSAAVRPWEPRKL